MWKPSEQNRATKFKIRALTAEREIYSHLDIAPADKTSALVSKVHAAQHESAFSPAQELLSARGPNPPESSADTGILRSSEGTDTSGTSRMPVWVSTHLIRPLLNISAKTTSSTISSGSHSSVLPFV